LCRSAKKIFFECNYGPIAVSASSLLICISVRLIVQLFNEAEKLIGMLKSVCLIIYNGLYFQIFLFFVSSVGLVKFFILFCFFYCLLFFFSLSFGEIKMNIILLAAVSP